MSQRQTRPPGSTLRKERMRKRIRELQWKDRRAENPKRLSSTAESHEWLANAFPIKRVGLARNLFDIGELFNDHVLIDAAFRLAELGLGGEDWKAVLRGSQVRQWNDDYPLVWVVEMLIAEGATPEAAYEEVAVGRAVGSLSFDGAVQAVKRAHLRWRDVPVDERPPIALPPTNELVDE